MLKKISIRLRLTILSILLLALCCVGLTAVLNLSANHMATAIEAILVTPTRPINMDETLIKEPINALETTPAAPLERSQATKTQFFYNSIFFMLLFVTLGGGLTYFISGKVLKPLQNLSEQMKSRTVHNLSEALPIPKNRDEISDLTQAFNEMTQKLEEAFAMQKRFSQSAAHELRTPLTVLKTKVDVFKKKQVHTSEEYDNLLTTITNHTNRLSDLVKDLLDLTNMDAINCDEPIILKAMLFDIVDELSPLAAKNNISLIIEGEDQTTNGNPSLLHRTFYNLIENAIKYNIENGNVTIIICKELDKCKITIADSGIGIAPELKEMIFEPFYRVDKSRTRQLGGAGLGLSIVKAIIENHCGTINVESNNDIGTVFEILI